MTVSRQLLEKYQESQTVSKWRVPSKSERGKEYIVRMKKNGEMSCNCIAGQRQKDCSHKQMVKSVFL